MTARQVLNWLRENDEQGELCVNGKAMKAERLTDTGRLRNNEWLQYDRRFLDRQFPEDKDRSVHYELFDHGSFLSIALHVESKTDIRVSNVLRPRLAALCKSNGYTSAKGGCELLERIDCRKFDNGDTAKREIVRVMSPFHRAIEDVIHAAMTDCPEAFADTQTLAVTSEDAESGESVLSKLQEFEKAIEQGLLDKLEVDPYAFSPFDVLRASDHEIRHSNVLGWLMDPNASHGMGDAFLREFLSRVNGARENKALGELFKKSSTLNCQISRETGRKGTSNDNQSGQMDLVLTFEEDKLLLVIENKWDAVEICEGTPEENDNTRRGQLSRYSAMMEGCLAIRDWNKVYVFLTPRGIKPHREDDLVKWIPLGYDAVLIALEVCVKSVKNERIRAFLEQYMQVITGKIGNRDEELCNKIYSSNEEALRFIKRWRGHLLRHARNEALHEVCPETKWECSNRNQINEWIGQQSSDALELAEKLYCAHRTAIDNILFNPSEHDLADDYPQMYFQCGRRFPSNEKKSVHYEIIDYGHGYDALQVCLHIEGRTDKSVKKQAELLVVPFKKNWPTIHYIGRSAEDVAADLRTAINWILNLFEPSLRCLG